MHKLIYLLILTTLCTTACLLTPGQIYAYERYNRVKKFDPYFNKYTKRFFGPGFDWRIFKAQAVAESRLNADAHSHVGAVGIMQIMPATFKEIKKKIPIIKGTREQPRWNIAAGIYYDRLIWKVWKAERSFLDKLKFTFGAYNAGKRHIFKAQAVAKTKGLDPNTWDSIITVLPLVTGAHSRETIDYVGKIIKIKEVMR